ncbi:Gfo/Idh/MocA family protein [Streptomyces sp. NPDC059853]|uniref:Gfo/Idh/MocA family protein n=1 Tax=Streptomyces sp. NPDC059853 TaxID=3346973 RepID=UPI0036529917
MEKRYKVAVIGLGKQANEDHIPGVLGSQKAELVAVCDTDSVRVTRTAAELSVPGFTDHTELLKAVDLDFVVVATPHHTHAQIVENAARAKVHILKEKPFATSGKEAAFLADVAREHGVEIMTTLQRRFNPIYNSYFQLADQIGDPFFVDVCYTMFIDAPHQGWRGSRTNAGGGCVIDMGYHMLDLIIWYLGMPSGVAATMSCQAVDAEYDAEDTASLLLRWPNGMHGTCILSRFVPPKRELVRVVGTRGIIEVERGSIRRLSNKGDVCEQLTRERAWGPAAATQVDFFCRVLAGERRNPGGPDYHRQHAAVIDACYESKATGTFIDPRKALI